MGRYTDIARSVKTQVAVTPSSVNQELIEAACTVGGKIISLFRTRESCLTAGHCLAQTTERDCILFPFRPGWCRERTRSDRVVKKHTRDIKP